MRSWLTKRHGTECLVLRFKEHLYLWGMEACGAGCHCILEERESGIYAFIANIRPTVKNAGEAGHANTIDIVGFANYARDPRFALMAFRSQGALCAHTRCNLYETVN